MLVPSLSVSQCCSELRVPLHASFCYSVLAGGNPFHKLGKCKRDLGPSVPRPSGYEPDNSIQGIYHLCSVESSNCALRGSIVLIKTELQSNTTLRDPTFKLSRPKMNDIPESVRVQGRFASTFCLQLQCGVNKSSRVFKIY
jgi:hypothetical protein